MTPEELDRVKEHEEPVGTDDLPCEPDEGTMDSKCAEYADQSNQPAGYSTESLELFRIVFNTAQKPDEGNVKFQRGMAITFTVILGVQVVWSMVMISFIIFMNSSMSTNALTFISLLVTAILAEVVAMAFVVVRFVFRTPLDTMIELLKEIIRKDK